MAAVGEAPWPPSLFVSQELPLPTGVHRCVCISSVLCESRDVQVFNWCSHFFDGPLYCRYHRLGKPLSVVFVRDRAGLVKAPLFTHPAIVNVIEVHSARNASVWNGIVRMKIFSL